MKEASSENKIENISKILHQRPPQGQFREQVFWLVDLIHACKESGNKVLIEEAKLMEEALKHISEYLGTGDMQKLSDATNRVSQFARIVKAAVSGKKLEFNVFLSYSTVDSDLFNIPEISRYLEAFPEIDKVLYWEKDSGQNIIEYMEYNLERAKVFVLFCTKNSKNSKSVKLEREAAIQLKQEERIRIIPVFQNPVDIPLLLKPFLGVQFDKEDFDGFIQSLHQEILRK
jgi:hypothetical protein